MQASAPQPTSQLEMLQPETQTLIMCHISTVNWLYSLLRASPRFYQVFRSRRGYHLTQLARQVCQHPASAWDAIIASKLPQPPSLDDVQNFTRNFQEDDGSKVPIMPLDVSIPMIRLGACVEWLMADCARDSLNNLTKLSYLMVFEQDSSLVHSELSDFEKWRIVRAFYRIETFRHLFRPALFSLDRDGLRPGKEFLMSYEFDEIEEIACARNYIVRRLLSIFDQIEDDLVEGKHPESVQRAAQAVIDDPETQNWFGTYAKSRHEYFVDHIMSLGLPFIKDVLTADARRRTELVLSNSTAAFGYITDVLDSIRVRYDPVPDLNYRPSSFQDDPMEPSIGWHWKWLDNPYFTPSSRIGTGAQDWGYVFWRKERMIGAGVLDQDLRMVTGYKFGEIGRREQPAALERLKDPQISRIPFMFMWALRAEPS